MVWFKGTKAPFFGSTVIFDEFKVVLDHSPDSRGGLRRFGSRKMGSQHPVVV